MDLRDRARRPVASSSSCSTRERLPAARSRDEGACRVRSTSTATMRAPEPDGSNFCSSCGAALETDSPARTPPSRSTRRRRSSQSSRGGRGRAEVDLDEIPAGVGVLVVKRGPNAGSRFALDKDGHHGGPPPRQRHLPRRHHRVAPPRRDRRGGRRATGCVTSARSTARTSTASASTRPRWPTATSCRSASSSSCSSLGGHDA